MMTHLTYFLVRPKKLTRRCSPHQARWLAAVVGLLTAHQTLTTRAAAQVASGSKHSTGRVADTEVVPPLDSETTAEDFERLANQAADVENASYCRYLRAEQRSETARLRSPWLSGRGSTLQRQELASGPQTDLTFRWRTGIGFSVSDWMRADLLEDQADSLCAVHRAQLALRPVDWKVEAITADGWKQKAHVLRVALDAADKIVVDSAAALQRHERTIDQHLRTVRARQLLHKELSETLIKLAGLATSLPPRAPSPDQEKTLRSHVAKLERVAGRLRRNNALSITLEAGHDEIVGTEQTLPIYAQVNASFRPGYFWQQSADDESATARAEAAALELSQHKLAYAKAVQHAMAQRALLLAEAERLRGFIRTLEVERGILRQTASPEAAVLAEQVWFEIESQRAELARLETSLQLLNHWVSEQSLRTPQRR